MLTLYYWLVIKKVNATKTLTQSAIIATPEGNFLYKNTLYDV